MKPGSHALSASRAIDLSPWWTVVGGALGVATGAGILVSYMWAIFAEAMVAQFHWDRTVPALCMFSFLFATGFGSVLFGRIVSRYGLRRSAIAFVLVFGISVATIALLPDIPGIFYGVFALMGMAGIAASPMPYAIAITGWFDKRRGLALGLMASGSGLSSVLAPQLARWLTDHCGWRSGLLAVAAIATTVPLLALVFLVRDPPGADRAAVAARSPGRTFSYLSDTRFWCIALPVFGVSISTMGVFTTLLVPLLTTRHFDTSEIATIISLAGLGTWFARIGVGYILDKLFAPAVLTGLLILTLCGVLALAIFSTPVADAVGVTLIALTLGAEADLLGFLVSRYFPFSSYSTVLGAVWIMWAWGGGVGSYIAGKTFDMTGTYDTALTVFGFALLLSILPALRLGPYRFPARDVRVSSLGEPDECVPFKGTSDRIRNIRGS